MNPKQLAELVSTVDNGQSVLIAIVLFATLVWAAEKLFTVYQRSGGKLKRRSTDHSARIAESLERVSLGQERLAASQEQIAVALEPIAQMSKDIRECHTDLQVILDRGRQ